MPLNTFRDGSFANIKFRVNTLNVVQPRLGMNAIIADRGKKSTHGLWAHLELSQTEDTYTAGVTFCNLLNGYN